MMWPNKTGHKTTAANSGKTGWRQDKMKILCAQIYIRFMQMMIIIILWYIYIYIYI